MSSGTVWRWVARGAILGAETAAVAAVIVWLGPSPLRSLDVGFYDVAATLLSLKLVATYLRPTED